MTDYSTIFDRALKGLRSQSWLSDEEFDTMFNQFKKLDRRKWSDAEIHSILTMVVFNTGFRAVTVEKKKDVILGHLPDYRTVSNYTDRHIEAMLRDPNMIKHKKKIKACISNAQVMQAIITKHRSFQNYFDTFNAHDSLENLLLLKEELEYRFDYLGGTTVYHFLTELGYNVLKPDRVIMRFFQRLGLVESQKQLLKAVLIGRKFAEAIGEPIRYVDIVFVKHGQEGESKILGIRNGICLNKPHCEVCHLHEQCHFYMKNQSKG